MMTRKEMLREAYTYASRVLQDNTKAYQVFSEIHFEGTVAKIFVDLNSGAVNITLEDVKHV